MKYRELTGRILSCFYDVYNELGFGFLEKVYERAMLIEMRKRGMKCEAQQPVSAFYSGEKVGEYFADIIVENKVIVELKAVSHIVVEHEYQLINYLKASEIEVGLLLNFGLKPKFKRKIFDIKIREDL
jgi:GxxExxY protein